jgi:hypothetical protein
MNPITGSASHMQLCLILHSLAITLSWRSNNHIESGENSRSEIKQV